MIKYNTKLYKTLRSLGFGFLLGKRAILSNGSGKAQLTGTEGATKGKTAVVTRAKLRQIGGADYKRSMKAGKKVRADFKAGKITEKVARSRIKSLNTGFIKRLTKAGKLPKGAKLTGISTT